MAVTVEDFPNEVRSQRRYPWDDWGDGRKWKLYRGFDFDVPGTQLQNRAHQMAAKRKMKANTQRDVEAREKWPDDVQESVSGPETEVLYLRFYDPAVESPA